MGAPDLREGRILLFDPRLFPYRNSTRGSRGVGVGGGGEFEGGRYYVFKFRYNNVFISSKYKTVTLNWNVLVSVSNTDQMCSRLKVLFLLNKGAYNRF